MSLPESGELRELLAIEPEHGVLSVYLHIDHADRGGGWRIALGDVLRDAVADAESDGDSDRAAATRATAERILKRFGTGENPPPERGHVGLVEIDAKGGAEHWWGSSAFPRQDAQAFVAPRPHLQPLLEMLDDHRRRGVVAVTGERARLLEWEQAELTELEAREILTTGDWRERKAARNVDVPSGQVPSSSGHDLHEQRLDDHRRRFVDEVADDIVGVADKRGWTEILCFGEAKYLSELEGRLGAERIAYTEDKNLIPMPAHELGERLAVLTGKLNRRRELALIERAESSALGGGRGALGLSETAQALAEGRVEHLLIAASELLTGEDQSVSELLGEGNGSRLPTGELLIERALATSAAITPVEDEAAERLAERGGVAALLRY